MSVKNYANWNVFVARCFVANCSALSSVIGCWKACRVRATIVTTETLCCVSHMFDRSAQEAINMKYNIYIYYILFEYINIYTHAAWMRSYFIQNIRSCKRFLFCSFFNTAFSTQCQFKINAENDALIVEWQRPFSSLSIAAVPKHLYPVTIIHQGNDILKCPEKRRQHTHSHHQPLPKQHHIYRLPLKVVQSPCPHTHTNTLNYCAHCSYCCAHKRSTQAVNVCVIRCPTYSLPYLHHPWSLVVRHQQQQQHHHNHHVHHHAPESPITASDPCSRPHRHQ